MPQPLSRHKQDLAQARITPPADDLHQPGPLPDSNAGTDTGNEPDRESPPGTPRWVKVFGIAAIVLLLLFGGLHLTGNAPTHMPGSNRPENGVQAP